MPIWSGEISELNNLYSSLRGNLPDIMKEMEQLIRTDDPNVVMLYSRRCLEVIITDLCETELKRPRKTEPLKGIIDKLNSEEKVPPYIITSMLSLNSMANYGAHPKDFDPEQVKPVLNNLAIIIKWYLKFKDFRIVSKSEIVEEKPMIKEKDAPTSPVVKSKSRALPVTAGIAGFILLLFFSLKVVHYFKVMHEFNLINKTNLEKGDYIIDARDKQPYSVVIIGRQVWMAENLKAIKFNDGTPIPLVKDNKAWEDTHTAAFCWYNNDKRANRDTYGALYNWYAATSGKLCPVGWHVPSTAEWTVLTKFVGDSIDWIMRGDSVPVVQLAGRKLKESGNDHWKFNDSISATNEYGFRALPGGERTVYGQFWDIGEGGSWWSSDENTYDKRDGYNREMYYNLNNVIDIEQYKQFGLSVRCIKDKALNESN